MPAASTNALLCFRRVWVLLCPLSGKRVPGFLLTGPEQRGPWDAAAPQIPVLMIPQGHSVWGGEIGHKADGSGSTTYGLCDALRPLTTFVS